MHGERGLNSGLQLALIFPLAFGLLLLTLQWAMVTWANSTALAAAQDGARAAAALHGTEGAGELAAVSAAGNGALQEVDVTVERTERRTLVTVTGTAVSVLPGLDTAVRRTAVVPTERLTHS